jgi:arabinogalactan oligomer/maltooligosaccharide transport system permease protein
MNNQVNTTQNTIAKAKEFFIHTFLYLQIAIMCLIVLVPIVWIVGSSFNQSPALTNATMIPQNPTLQHYVHLLTETRYLRWALNSLQIAIFNTILSVFLSASVGFIFARFVFKGKKVALITILVLQMFPSFMAMTALYVLFLTFGLLDTHLALLLVYSAGQIPFNTWLIKGFLDSVPKELDESAMLDGASKIQIFTKIIFPLAKPILAFVAVSAFMTPWMDFIFPRLILRSNDNLTLAVGLYNMIAGNQNEYTIFAAGAVLVAIPITILFVVFQKYMIEGITAGANKG